MDLLGDGITFKLAVLLAIAGIYVLFELVLLAVEAGAKRRPRRWLSADEARLGVEAHTSWTSRLG